MKRECRVLGLGACALLAVTAALAGSITTDNLTVGQQTTLSGAVTIAPAIVPTDSYVLVYTLDSNSTSVTDGSANGNTGTVNGGAVWTNGGKIAGAFTFDGTNDYIQAADSASLDVKAALTISAWARFDSTSGIRELVSKHDDANNQAYDVHFENGAVMVLISSGGGNGTRYNFYVPTAASSPNWTHYVVTWDGTPNANAAVYVNGASQTISNLATLFTGTNIYNSSQPLRVGAKSDGSWYFAGAIDEVRIYSRALSSSEVGALYAAGTGAPGVQSLTVAASVATTFSGTTTISRLVKQGDVDMGVYTNGP